MAAILPNNSKTSTLNLELTVVWFIAVFLFLTPQVLIMLSSKCDTKQPLHKLLKTFLPLRLEIVGVDYPPVCTLYTRTLNLSHSFKPCR